MTVSPFKLVYRFCKPLYISDIKSERSIEKCTS